VGPRAPLVVAPVVAASDAPKLRPDLVVRRILGPDEASWVVKDPVTRKYFRFPETSGRLLSSLDGQTSLLELQQRLRAGGAPAPSLGALENLVQQLRAMDLLVLPPTERLEHQLEQMRTDRRLRVRTRNVHGSLLHYRISLWDPDQWMERVVPRLGFFWTPTFVLLSLIALAAAVGTMVVHWDRFAGEIMTLISGRAGLPRYVLLILLSLIIIAIHELGHGLTCKYFGGHVHEIGFLMLYFTPCFYCNVTDAWLFERRSERLWVTLAGVYVELFVGALATFVWWATEPEHPVNILAFQVALLSSLGALALNLNPLLKQDGYYALVDYLGVPNLREHAFRYVGTLVQRSRFGSQAAVPALTDRRRRILITYGLAAGAYSVSLLILFTFRTFDILVRNGRDWGVAGFMGLAVGLIGLPIWRKVAASGVWRPGRPASRHSGTPPPTSRGGSRKRRPATSWLLFAGVLIALATIPRWSMPVRLRCVFEPDQAAVVYAPEDAQVVQVLCAEGQRVEAGQPLLRLQARDLSADRARGRLELASLQLREREAQRTGDLAAWREVLRQVQAQQRELEQLEKRAGGLALSSPVAGICLTPPEELMGRALRRGSPLLAVADTSRLVAVVAVDPSKTWDVRKGAAVHVRPHALPGTTLRGRAQTVLPADGGLAPSLRPDPEPGARTVDDAWRPAFSFVDSPSPGEQSMSTARGLRVSVPVVNPGALRPGMTGSVKVYGPARSFFGHLWEATLRLLRADLWG
jgi:putative peptide zinc metalloprotease protein